VIGVSEDAVLGIVLGERSGDAASDDKVLMLLGKVSFGERSPLPLDFAVDSFFEPVGHERA
jgi:hypothetical protein